MSTGQQHTQPDRDNHRAKKKHRYSYLDKGAPFRAIVAHQFRQFCRINKTKKDLEYFAKNLLPHIPGTNVHYDAPNIRSLGRWVDDYDEGMYDDILAVYNETPIKIQKQILPEVVNSAVLDKLCALGMEEL
eukprot:CAMPEP_0196806972 /NCGR_PEP_ID=MMETSP1362-20130617/6914_1 /TAXON_ID=163516 /ORGANISM="Leptocylindrus danicus, Strain CCMP1856" /LENGTH=130 /DNA_ID=CAMNT_0042180687 /DNA_START=113 /DNA_END=501 /DNA_ORIENTATION=+